MRKRGEPEKRGGKSTTLVFSPFLSTKTSPGPKPSASLASRMNGLHRALFPFASLPGSTEENEGARMDLSGLRPSLVTRGSSGEGASVSGVEIGLLNRKVTENATCIREEADLNMDPCRVSLCQAHAFAQDRPEGVLPGSGNPIIATTGFSVSGSPSCSRRPRGRCHRESICRLPAKYSIWSVDPTKVFSPGLITSSKRVCYRVLRMILWSGRRFFERNHEPPANNR